MIIIGVDYHPSVQQIAYVDTETGETCERRLNHSDGEAEHFYRALERRQVSVRVGIEATGHARWFERLLAELKFELWIGNAAEIKAARVRKQKTDRQDALLLLRLLVEDRCPRIWVPSPESRDLASTSPGADAHTSHEPDTGHGHERGRTPQEDAVEQGGMPATGVAAASSMGHTAPPRSAGVGGSTERDHR